MKTFATKGKANSHLLTSLWQPQTRGNGQSLFGLQNHLSSGVASLVQTRLTVNQPGDKFEEEADRVAEQVITMPAPRTNLPESSERGVAIPHIQRLTQTDRQRLHRQNDEQEEERDREDEEEELVQAKFEFSEPALIQRQETEPEEEEEKEEEEEEATLFTKRNGASNSMVPTKLEDRIKSRLGRGQALPEQNRAFYEPRFGHDFSQIRIHSDSQAADTARALNARAFTIGSDIFFGPGRFQPETRDGRRLLAHELVHAVQQDGTTVSTGSNILIHKTGKQVVQGGFFGDLWEGVKDVASAVGRGISSVGRAIGGALGSAWEAATSFLGEAASWAWEGLKSLGSTTLEWLSSAGTAVWDAIKWFGNKAWEGIRWLGSFLWEKLALLGTNAWSFISNLPKRLWRIVVHGWEGLAGALDWLWTGLKRLAGHAWDAVKGVFEWLGSGLSGALSWLADGVKRGADWAVDFIQDPSLDKLWNGLVGSLSWAWEGITGFAQWGWQGVVGAAKWVWDGISGFASWLWDGIVNGLEWAGRLLLYTFDLVGGGEILQIMWGLIFRMRPLTQDEIDASLEVHPSGLIPYSLVRVDDNSVLTWINGGRAVTTMHVLHYPRGGLALDVVVHELTHVAQYEKVGSVYMAEAIHAQAFGSGYDYGNLQQQRNNGKRFKDFNREQQAQICEDYYSSKKGLPTDYTGTLATLQPFIDDMRRGEF